MTEQRSYPGSIESMKLADRCKHLIDGNVAVGAYWDMLRDVEAHLRFNASAQSAVKQIELEEIARRAVHEYPVASGLYVDADSKAGYGALRDLRLFLGIDPAGHATSVVPSTTCPKPCPQLAQ